jgi:hypothetical protein
VCIGYISFASLHPFDVARVDHPGHYVHRYQGDILVLLVNAGALHDNHIVAERVHPFGQRFAAALEPAKFASVH